MNEEVYTLAFKSALTEIKNICPDIGKSFILMSNGTLIAAEATLGSDMERVASSIQDLAEKASSVGGLDGLMIDGESGRVYISRINGMYFISAPSKQADLTYLRNVTGVILPTILKVLDSLDGLPRETEPPTPLKPAPHIPFIPSKSAPSEPLAEKEIVEETEEETEISEPEEVSEAAEEAEPELEVETEADVESKSSRWLTDVPSQQLIVDRFGGLMVRSDTVQIDSETLQRWGSLLDVGEIHEVDIETFSGKTTRGKVKVINDQKYEGRGLIRIPEKMCDTIEVRKGELVRVKPVVPESE